MVRLLGLLAIFASLSLVSAAPSVPAERSLAPRVTKRTQLSTFCDKFRASCRSVCLERQSGPQHIKFACDKNPNTKDYEFFCSCNGHIRTGSALDGVPGPKPIYTTVSTSTFSTLSTVEVDSTTTESKGKTTQTSLETHTSTIPLPVKSTTLTQQTLTTTTKDVAGTETVYSRTTTTSTRSYSRGIVTFPTVTTETHTIIQKSIVASTGPAESGRAVLRVATPNKGSGSVSSSSFCQGYATSCDRTCTRLESSASETTCKRTDTDTVTRYYDLYCKCANGKVETSHALADIDGAIEGPSTISVTALSTSISYTSFTDLVTIPVATLTTTIRSTKSVVAFDPPPSTITRTFSTLVVSTSLHHTDATQTIKTTSTAPRVTSTIVTTTVTSPQTASQTTTTMLAIAPTGRMRLDSNGQTRGYLASTYDGKRAGAINSTSEALDLVLVSSPYNTPDNYYSTYAVVDMATGNALVPDFSGNDYYNRGPGGPLGIPGTIDEAIAAGSDEVYWLLRTGATEDANVPDGGTDIGFTATYDNGYGYLVVRTYSREPKIGAEKNREPYLYFGDDKFRNHTVHPSFLSKRVGLTFEFAGKAYST